MIVFLNKNENNDKNIGNKGKYLLQMLKAGFNVPGGIILDIYAYDEFINDAGIKSDINKLLKNLDKSNVSDISLKICRVLNNKNLPKKLQSEIDKFIDDKKLYAVRSSGSAEDLANYSFAGQYSTFLNVSKKDICNKVIECYKSMFGETNLSYIINQNISIESMKMSVIIQEMVDADISGVCFNIDPTTGIDKQMLIEISEGLGENFVSGKTAPEQYFYDWYNDTEVKKENDVPHKFLSSEKLSEIAHTFGKIQQFFGYPCDIEFAISKGVLYILQSRAITKLSYTGTPYMWTTADFKDGGISATICTPYMWSLYEYIWEYSLRKFIVDSKILRDDELPRKLGEMFYGRPYWNMSAVKKTMSQIIGYKEREFDNEYGIIGNYSGDGQVTKINPKSVFKMIRIVYHQTRLLHDRQKNSDKYKSELLDKYFEYKEKFDTGAIQNITNEFYEITHDTYLRSETTYFWQIFINTIHQSIYKDSLLKYVSESDYLSLLGSIDNISHLLPFYDIWTLTRHIRNDNTTMNFWLSHSENEIAGMLESNDFYLPETAEIINKYGYHSDKELDITYPCYYEEPQSVIRVIKNTITLDDSFSPEKDKENGKKVYNEILRNIKENTSNSKYKSIVKKIENMRRMLWWREEFRDVSTRFYYMLRMYTIEYAKYLQSSGVFENWEDVWFLKVGDLWEYISGTMNADQLKQIIDKNKIYYASYRNYMSENEIGSNFTVKSDENSSKNTIKGLGANNGSVTATARLIKDLSEIDRLQEGDILVTKFTDTGWTPKFAILSGIVTEYGGILCHAAIVSREYGIPAIVCCKDAMSKISDGQTITLDGTTGTVIL